MQFPLCCLFLFFGDLFREILVGYGRYSSRFETRSRRGPSDLYITDRRVISKMHLNELGFCLSLAAAPPSSSIPSRTPACTCDRESRSPKPPPSSFCTGRGRIRFLGSAPRDCSLLHHRGFVVKGEESFCLGDLHGSA